MKPATRASFWLGLSSLWIAGCAAPLEAPTAYSSERFLCPDEQAAAFDAFVEQCRTAYDADRSCPGIASFSGIVDGHAIVVDALLSDASYSYDPQDPNNLRSLVTRGDAPYFRFALSMDRTTDPGSAGFCSQTGGTRLFNIEVRGSSTLKTMRFRTCNVQPYPPDGMRTSFSADFVRGGSLDGCIFLFVGSGNPAPE